MDFKDYYATLGVAKSATDKELKTAYRKLARKHHPDVNPGDKAAEAKFKEINEAYEVLGEPDKRKKYDELGANWRMYEQAGAGAGAPFDQGAMRRLALKHDGRARTVDVRIPAGVGDGSRVRVAGEGEHGAGGGASGDLYLRIRLAPHGQFERRGRDLYTKVPVPLTTAVLGGEVDVPALGGRTLRLKVPPTTQNGQVFRLRGQGLALAGKNGERSDLYATVDVQLPRQLSPEQRARFEELAKTL